jgi:hypothetical protein
MSSFKSPQPSPIGVVLSLARALGLVSSADDVVIVPLSQWHAMHDQKERADQNELDRRDAVARAQVAEAGERRLAREVEDAHQLIAARDERIKELNTWLDSHVPMVFR